jgi:environmental stress-induced protein Ves
MRLLRSADHRVMRWKNGGGETIEVAVSPEGASLDDFDWRVSMAKVAVDGPFSSFPEIERTLCVLEGDGIVLAIEGQAPVRLTTASAPLAFRADVPVSASLIGTPIVDLNVMTRRTRFRHSIERMSGSAAVALRCRRDAVTLVLNRTHGATIAATVGNFDLGINDVAILDSGDEAQLRAVAGVLDLAVIEIARVQPGAITP